MISEKKSVSVKPQKAGAMKAKKPMTFSIITLGCKVNQYESESIAREMTSSGFIKLEKQAALKEKLDIGIINTCTVTQKASMQSRQAIRQMIRANPDAAIIVTGCLAQTAPEEIQAIKGVLYIVGHADKFRIPDIASSIKSDRDAAPEIIHNSVRDIQTFQDMQLSAIGSRTRSFLKIQDGCDAFCTYCIVPFARGPNRSMPMEHVLQHVRHIHDAGHREIVLTGIHLGRYGTDLSPALDLHQLLKRLHESECMDRIRLSSIEPLELTDALIDLVARANQRPGQICPHFHIPLQSGDDHILKRMHRPYRRNYFRTLVFKILNSIPHAAVGADVLIGFPGETDDEFLNTFHLLDELPLAYLHVFPFSPRKGTPAASYPDHVPPPVVKERCRRTRALGVQKRSAFMKKWLHQKMEILVEGTRDPHTGMLKGVTANYIKVIMEGEDRLQNTFQTVRIDGLADGQTLLGRL